MMARTSACASARTSGDSTSCSAGMWRTGPRVMSCHACSTTSRPWVKRVTKEEAKRSKSNRTVKLMLNKEHHNKVVNGTKANVARDFKR